MPRGKSSEGYAMRAPLANPRAYRRAILAGLWAQLQREKKQKPRYARDLADFRRRSGGMLEPARGRVLEAAFADRRAAEDIGAAEEGADQ